MAVTLIGCTGCEMSKVYDCIDSKTAQKRANELQRRAAYSGKWSDKADAARAAQRLADRIRKDEKLNRRLASELAISG